MSCSKKMLKYIKYGLSSSTKKIGVNYWRFFFNGVSSESSRDQMFYIEFEMINPWLSPKDIVLGYSSRVTIKEEDLQYALAGTESAKNLQTESILQPSYCVLRVGMLGEKSKQICSYFPVKDVKFNPKTFEFEIGNKYFSSNKLSGFVNVTEKFHDECPELMCDPGNANWNISYEILSESTSGLKNDGNRWFPCGLKTEYSGKINFDGVDYYINPKTCFGYSDRYWGKALPSCWFHISASNLSSIISGKNMFNSNFAIQGIFEDKVSFLGNFEGLNINLCQTNHKKYDSIWSCVQTPESEEITENQLHWSVSLHNKTFVIDVDVYCKLTDLYNRKIECPAGNRKVLSIVEGGNCLGEIRIYKKIGSDIEQLEYAKIEKALCQFGQEENFES